MVLRARIAIPAAALAALVLVAAGAIGSAAASSRQASAPAGPPLATQPCGTRPEKRVDAPQNQRDAQAQPQRSAPVEEDSSRNTEPHHQSAQQDKDHFDKDAKQALGCEHGVL